MLIRIFFFLILFIFTFQSHIHSTIYLYSNDNFSDILINNNSIIQKTLNYSNVENKYCFKINLKLNINDKLTFITKNLINNFYFAFYIIFYDSNGNYFYSNENNNNLISSNITNENFVNVNIVNDFNIYNECSLKFVLFNYALTTENNHENEIVEFYFTVPNNFDYFSDYNIKNCDFEIIGNKIIKIDLNENNVINPEINFNTDNIKLIVTYDNSLNGNLYNNYYIFMENNSLLSSNTFFYSGANYKYFYNDTFYLSIYHDNLFNDENNGIITIKYCPNFCSRCNYYYKICANKNISNSLINNITNSLKDNYFIIEEEIIQSNYIMLIYNTSNPFNYSNIDYNILTLDLCIEQIKEYHYLNNLIISAKYNDNNIISVYFYNENGTLLAYINDSNNINSICTSEDYYYNPFTLNFVYCIYQCKKYCPENTILTSIKKCVNVNKICGDKRKKWYFEYINNTFTCIDNYTCTNQNYYVSDSNECINKTCSDYYYNFLYTCNYCNNNSRNYIQIYNHCINTSEINSFVLSNPNEFLYNDDIFSTTYNKNETYFIDNYPLKSNNESYSKVLLNECENILKKHYNISNILFVKYENSYYFNNTAKVEYYAYDNDNNLLDLNLCSNYNISLQLYFLQKENISYDLAHKLSLDGIDLYNLDDDFYINYCNNEAINKTDLTLANRIDDVYINVDFCQNKYCEYSYVNFTEEYVLCNCNASYVKSNKNEKSKSYFIELLNNIINFKIFKCYKYFINKNSYKNNFGFLFSLILSILMIIFMILFIIYWK